MVHPLFTPPSRVSPSFHLVVTRKAELATLECDSKKEAYLFWRFDRMESGP